MTIAQKPQRTPILPAIIEVIAGLLGFLGIGWIFSGRVFTGLKILFIYWAAIFAFAFGISMVTILTFGFASLLYLILAPLTIIIYLAAPVVSGGKLYNQMRQENKSRQSIQITEEPPKERLSPSVERYIEERNKSQTQGLEGWQVAIVIGLTIMATLVFGSLAVLLLGYFGAS